MSKYKVGDKFIGEILEIYEDDYGKIMYGLGSGKTHSAKDEYEVDALQPYHEPTLKEHALALQDNCEKYYDGEKCDGCDFTKGCLTCVLLDAIPKRWDLGKQPKLTKQEREILEFWEKQGANRIYKDGINKCFRFYDKERFQLGIDDRYELFSTIKDDYTKNIDKLLKGE